jgi:AraC-like DNA-binding protein
MIGPAATIDFGQSMSSYTQAELAASLPHAALERTWRVERHTLLLVNSGHGSYEVDFVAYPARPGTLLWVRPGQTLRLGTAPGLDAIILIWPPGYLPDLPAAPWPPEDPFGPVCWQLAGEDEDAVIDEVSQLMVDRDRGLTGDLLRHQLAVLILRLAQVPPVGPDPGGGPERETYLRFRREVETAYAECRQVSVYATRLGCSVRTLTRACLHATGRTAKQVIDDRVVLEARRMLAATSLPVAAIAERLGFTEPTHFGRLFHRSTGLPPGSFRATVPAPRH